MSSPASASKNQEQPPGNVLVIPKQDPTMKARFANLSRFEVRNNSARQFFEIWDKVLKTNVVHEEDKGQGMSVFTVADSTFYRMIPQDIADPFLVDKYLQRLVLATQLVASNIKPDSIGAEEVRVSTVGDRTLVLKKSEGQLTVNDVPVKEVFVEENSTVYLLEKILWIRPEDISSAIGNMSRDPPLVK